jgi:N-acetylmuramic acid 6-phosphate etherase
MILTEQPHPKSRDLDQLSTERLMTLMNQADYDVAMLVTGQVARIAAVVNAVADRLDEGGRLFYVGAGTSGRLGVLDASECPPTFGVSPELVQGIIAGGRQALTTAVEGAEDDAAAGSRDLRAMDVTAKDAVVGIAASGGTPYVRGAITAATETGALTACVVCVPNSPIAAMVQFPIEVVTGPEILTGATRLRAGTATKMVLNMISTGVMVKLGHVYGNLMVNVQPTNAKLQDRARRIIQEITGAGPDRASELFEISGGNVRLAIIMEKKGLSRDAAQELLDSVKGRLRAALAK